MLNELLPSVQPGAATIALEFAIALSKENQVLFAHSSNEVSSKTEESLQLLDLSVRRRKYPSGYFGEAVKILRDLFDIPSTYRLFKVIRLANPEIIWVHQIGNIIPRLLLFFLPLIAPVIMTTHDYGLIVPRKLYPYDLKNSQLQTLGVEFDNCKSNRVRSLHSILIKFLYGIRRVFLRIYVKNLKIVCISDLQSSIYKLFNYKVSAVIPNGISKCFCTTRKRNVNKRSVLFIGRSTGKGIERLVKSVRKQNFKLFLAGGSDLIQKVHDSNDYGIHYLGYLTRSQVIDAIHQIPIVYVASECFDVFPTVGLEAIRHGALPILSDTTGLRDIVKKIDPKLVLTSKDELVPLEAYLDLLINEDNLKKQLAIANEQLLTVEESLQQYLKLT